jgi:hypothetical protein
MQNGVSLLIGTYMGLIYEKNRGSKISCYCPFKLKLQLIIHDVLLCNVKI